MQILEKTNLNALKLAKKIGKEKVLQILEKKELVGRGGSAFPTAKKWKLALSKKSERYLICNADEGEPGTFKDKFILKNNPETLIEGILIASHILGVKKAYIYLRGEYEYLRKDLEKTIKKVLKDSKQNTEIKIVRGAGAYICGEETAIIQSIEGNRGHAMYKPPYPTIEGLWGKPTVINNVETLTCVSQAIYFDDWNPNLRLFSISGNVKKPGVYEIELGTKMSKILKLVEPKGKLKAVSFGCFGGIMPVKKSERIDYKTLFRHGCHHGAFSLILINKDQNIIDLCISIAKFYTYESCGKCTPCREGNIRLLNLLKKIKQRKATKKDIKILKEFSNHIQETSLCGLGQSCGNHILTSLKNFKSEYNKLIK